MKQDIVRNMHTGEPGNPGGFGSKKNDEATATLDAAAEGKTFTCFGRWVDDEIVIDYTVEGDIEDHRPDSVGGYQSFCASGTGLTAEDVEEDVMDEYDPEPEPELKVNPIFEQLRAEPNRHDPAVLDKYIRELDQIIERPETMLDADGFLRTDMGPRVSLSSSNSTEIGKARQVLKRLARLRDAQ